MEIKFRWSLIIVLLLFQVGCATKMMADTVVIGTATNGINAKVFIIWQPASFGVVSDLPQNDFFVNVFVCRQGESIVFTNYPSLNLKYSATEANFYWGATNSFCGPIELQNESGKKLHLLKPSVSSPESYPDCFNFAPLWEKWFYGNTNQIINLQGPMPGQTGPGFLYVGNRYYRLCSFYLGDYFKLKQVGEYKLTIWPKIYKCSATNDDLFERIDIPPINIPINWNGN